MSTPINDKPTPSTPKYQLLASQFRRRIASGELRAGHRLPTFVEMYDHFGATPTTVTRVYELLEREGLVTRTHGSGVFIAHPQQAKKTGTIGFIIGAPLQSHPYYLHLLEGVRREAELAGVEVLLLSDKSSVRWEKLDGVLYPMTLHGQLDTPPGMSRISLIYAQPHLDSAVADDYSGMAQAMEHLIELGHRRIAFLTQEMQPHAGSHQRMAAYNDSLRSQGIEPPEVWMRCLHEPDKCGRTWEETGYDDMQQWLEAGWSTLNCTALLAHNDEVAIGVIAALQAVGLRVPTDISVVGFDGTEIAHFHRPRLTTVKVPLEEIGARGFELLMRQVHRPLSEMDEDRSPHRLSLPTQLTVGETTAPVAVRNRRAKKVRTR